MKSPYVGTLEPNESVTACFLVLSKDIRQKKTGEPYLSLQLSDRTGDIEAKMWDNVAEVMHTFERDDFVKVRGLVQVYQNRHQFTVHRIRRLEEHEVEFNDYFPCSDRDPEEMLRELHGIIQSVSDAHLKMLLENIFTDPSIISRYKVAPAAKSIHHACRGGLLEHVLSLCRLCRLVGPHYKGIDIDLLQAGALLHDIGKIEELSYERSFGYSAAGQLLGHIAIGLRMLGEKVSQIPNFPPKLRTLLEHMILSHHGELEFGSPKVPIFEEALLLHHLDNLDSKMETMRNALKRPVSGDEDFTGWIAPLERTVLRKTQWLSQNGTAKAKASAPPPAASVVEPSPASVAPPPASPQPATSQPAPPQPGLASPEPPAPPQAPLHAAPAHPAPAMPVAEQLPPPPKPERPLRPERPPHSHPQNTLFGEKLQAVLGSRNNN